MYTVTIKAEITNGEVISRFFDTKKAAQKWFKWLCSQKMTLRSSFYRGEASAELLERYESAAKGEICNGCDETIWRDGTCGCV